MGSADAGLVAHTGPYFGLLTNLIGAVVLGLWIPPKQKLGIGSVAKMLLIGPSASFGSAVIPQQTEP